jgi:hypothetical protein
MSVSDDHRCLRTDRCTLPAGYEPERVDVEASNRLPSVLYRTELIDFMMDFVEDQRAIVVVRVVSHDVNHRIPIEDIHHFDLFEIDHCSTTGAARNILH